SPETTGLPGQSPYAERRKPQMAAAKPRAPDPSGSPAHRPPRPPKPPLPPVSAPSDHKYQPGKPPAAGLKPLHYQRLPPEPATAPRPSTAAADAAPAASPASPRSAAT